jgi:hypothetical protein
MTTESPISISAWATVPSEFGMRIPFGRAKNRGVKLERLVATSNNQARRDAAV